MTAPARNIRVRDMAELSADEWLEKIFSDFRDGGGNSHLTGRYCARCEHARWAKPWGSTPDDFDCEGTARVCPWVRDVAQHMQRATT